MGGDGTTGTVVLVLVAVAGGALVVEAPTCLCASSPGPPAAGPGSTPIPFLSIPSESGPPSPEAPAEKTGADSPASGDPGGPCVLEPADLGKDAHGLWSCEGKKP